MRGYYSKPEVRAAIKGLTGLVEVTKRVGRWEHMYPARNRAEVRILSEHDYIFETVNYSDICEGFEYVNITGGKTKVINVTDALDYPMPVRW